MAIDLLQHRGFSHTLLNVAFNAQASLPYTFVAAVNPPTSWVGSDQFILFLGRSTASPPQNGYRLQLVSSGSDVYKVRGTIQATHFGADFNSATAATGG